MKELSIEEKAKAYDKALNRAKLLKEHPEKVITENNKSIHTSDYIFPELRESKDERVKKILHSISSKMSFHLHDIFTEEEFQYFDAWSIAWLKKQGEQTPVEWSEEDERIYQSIMDDTVQENQLDDKQTKWLSDIKYRYFPQPKQDKHDIT